VYQIKLSRRAEKDLASIPQDIRIHIELALERFAKNPDMRHDVVKVRDSPKVMPQYPFPGYKPREQNSPEPDGTSLNYYNRVAGRGQVSQNERNVPTMIVKRQLGN